MSLKKRGWNLKDKLLWVLWGKVRNQAEGSLELLAPPKDSQAHKTAGSKLAQGTPAALGYPPQIPLLAQGRVPQGKKE